MKCKSCGSSKIIISSVSGDYRTKNRALKTILAVVTLGISLAVAKKSQKPGYSIAICSNCGRRWKHGN